MLCETRNEQNERKQLLPQMTEREETKPNNRALDLLDHEAILAVATKKEEKSERRSTQDKRVSQNAGRGEDRDMEEVP